ncbi:MAG: HEAT repeat domain-containing protein, partial [bacterium]
LLMKSMEDKDEAVRAAATKSFGDLSGAGEFSSLLEKIQKSRSAGDIAAMAKALSLICGGATKPEACVQKLADALSKSGPDTKLALLRVLGVTGGGDALKVVRAAVDDLNKDVHTAAIRVISEWKTGDAAPVLLDLVKRSSAPVDKILSLRGYLGMAVLKDVPAQDKLAICRESKPMIQRDDEKLLLLGALSNLADAGSLDLVVPYLDDQAVKRDAVSTVMAIAEKREKKQNTVVAREALGKVMKVAADNQAVIKRAEEMLKQMETE